MELGKAAHRGGTNAIPRRQAKYSAITSLMVQDDEKAVERRGVGHRVSVHDPGRGCTAQRELRGGNILYICWAP